MEIKHTGDGIMASFPSASGALECAVAIQLAVDERQAEPVEAALRVRIGLNAGEPVAEEEDLFGTAVQLGMKVLGISCMVNKAAGLSKKPLGHMDVLRTMQRIKKPLSRLIKEIINNLKIYR